jgi:hypothetical protein
MVGKNCGVKKLLETGFSYSFGLLEIWPFDVLRCKITVMPLLLSSIPLYPEIYSDVCAKSY